MAVMLLVQGRNKKTPLSILQGQFQEFWDANGVSAGDVLTFERLPSNEGKIKVKRYPSGIGLEEALDGRNEPEAIKNGTTSAKISSGDSRPATKPSLTEVQPTIINAHLNSGTEDMEDNWLELPDNFLVINISQTMFSQKQCPIPAWVFKKVSMQVQYFTKTKDVFFRYLFHAPHL